MLRLGIGAQQRKRLYDAPIGCNQSSSVVRELDQTPVTRAWRSDHECGARLSRATRSSGSATVTVRLGCRSRPVGSMPATGSRNRMHAGPRAGPEGQTAVGQRQPRPDHLPHPVGATRLDTGDVRQRGRERPRPEPRHQSVVVDRHPVRDRPDPEEPQGAGKYRIEVIGGGEREVVRLRARAVGTITGFWHGDRMPFWEDLNLSARAGATAPVRGMPCTSRCEHQVRDVGVQSPGPVHPAAAGALPTRPRHAARGHPDVVEG